MKYFTIKLFDEMNSNKKEIAQKAEKQWDTNVEAYSKHLEQIDSFLPKRLSVFLEKNISLHNGVVLSTEYGSYQKTEKKWKRKRKDFLCMRIWHPAGKHIYTLEFTEVRKYQYDYYCVNEGDRDVRWEEKEWACEEFTVLEDNWICFEMWMFEGDRVVVEFKKFDYFKEIISPSDYYILPGRWARNKP